MGINKTLWWLTLPVVMALSAALPALQRVTVDDLMHLRSISDVRISPDGKQIAYVVSTPSFETAAHEGVLYRIPVSGGTPLRLTYQTRIFNKPLPAPCLRWSPDGSLLSFIGYLDGVPQVMAMAAAGGEPWALTSMKEGVTHYEWSPDGKQIAFLAPDPPSGEEEKERQNKSYVIHVDQDQRRPRVWLQEVSGGAPKAVTPPDQTALDVHWAPDGKELTYAASSEIGFNAPYDSTVYVISAAGGEPRAIVKRPGTNRMPQYSPDGRFIAFISSGGHPGMINAMDLYVVAADGSGSPRGLTIKREVWVSEFLWAPDSRRADQRFRRQHV